MIEIKSTVNDKLLEGVGIWGSFYRENPQRFVEEYLNIKLKLFQKKSPMKEVLLISH